MSRHAHRITAVRTPRPPLTCWHYRSESRLGTAFSTCLGDAHPRQALADIAIAPPQVSHAEARAVVAAALDRLPGLTIVAAPVRRGPCLLGDRSGETALTDGVPAELAAVAGYLWLATGRRLGTLGRVCTGGLFTP